MIKEFCVTWISLPTGCVCANDRRMNNLGGWQGPVIFRPPSQRKSAMISWTPTKYLRVIIGDFLRSLRNAVKTTSQGRWIIECDPRTLLFCDNTISLLVGGIEIFDTGIVRHNHRASTLHPRVISSHKACEPQPFSRRPRLNYETIENSTLVDREICIRDAKGLCRFNRRE